MQITKNTGRIVGVLFLLTVITGAWGTATRGFSGVEPNTTGFLDHIITSTSQMKLAIGLDMLGSAISVLIAIYLYPIIKKNSARLAIAYIGIALVSFTIITISNVVHISLLSVASEYSLATNPNTENFTTLTAMHHSAYYWAHFVLLMCYAIGGSVLYYFLLKTELVPKWLAIWGILAQTIVFAGGALQLFEIPVSFYLFIQNGVFILSFILFLLIIGFKTEKYNALD